MKDDYNKHYCHYCGNQCTDAFRERINDVEFPICYDCYSKILYQQRLKAEYNFDEFC